MSSIARLIARCHHSILPNGEIPYTLRRKLLILLDKLDQKNTDPLSTRLMMKCAEKTINFWEQKLPNNRVPHSLLQNLELAIVNKFDADKLEAQAQDLQAFLENLFDEGEPAFRACYAGFSCLAAAWSFLYGINPTQSKGEIEIDPDEWDSSFYSSCAYSGSAVWEDANNSESRKEFWKWYLGTAEQITTNT